MGSHHGPPAHGAQTQRRLIEPQTYSGGSFSVGSTVGRPHHKNLPRKEVAKTMQTESTDYTRQQSKRTNQGAGAAGKQRKTASNEHTESSPSCTAGSRPQQSKGFRKEISPTTLVTKNSALCKSRMRCATSEEGPRLRVGTTQEKSTTQKELPLPPGRCKGDREPVV